VPQGGDFYLDVGGFGRGDWHIAVRPTKKSEAGSPTVAAALTLPPAGAAATVASPVISGIDQQKAFIAVVQQARQAYNGAANDMQKGGIRAGRKDAICKLLPSMSVENWQGEIYQLSSNSDGKGVVGITIGPDIYIKTWNNALSDIEGHTLLDPESAPFKNLSLMKKGDWVKFSGSFLSSDVDCVREGSLTQRGSMTQPEFIFQFAAASAEKDLR
jgi:hypothetical protein